MQQHRTSDLAGFSSVSFCGQGLCECICPGSYSAGNADNTLNCQHRCTDEGEMEPCTPISSPDIPDEGQLHGRDGRDRVSVQHHALSCNFICLFSCLVTPWSSGKHCLSFVCLTTIYVKAVSLNVCPDLQLSSGASNLLQNKKRTKQKVIVKPELLAGDSLVPESTQTF